MHVAVEKQSNSGRMSHILLTIAATQESVDHEVPFQHFSLKSQSHKKPELLKTAQVSPRIQIGKERRSICTRNFLRRKEVMRKVNNSNSLSLSSKERCSSHLIICCRAALRRFNTQSVLILGIAATHEQDLALGLVELHGVCMDPSLKPVKVFFLKHINSTSQLDTICILAEDASNPIIYAINK
ncbi:hypothetical protein WISP_109300 [Willisornis vidua]|uniref:Ribosomal protein L7Ae/L30e/S12e/Gadd45 domain-containing protein n=1 Tax=Willisornis vidua TaxID=1566151 RepID=A0ABQ9CW47_9PASS|nr:hypothetical protein WISP_109300 [Willisornis vidua]